MLEWVAISYFRGVGDLPDPEIKLTTWEAHRELPSVSQSVQSLSHVQLLATP